jgi:hypothetical protein
LVEHVPVFAKGYLTVGVSKYYWSDPEEKL